MAKNASTNITNTLGACQSQDAFDTRDFLGLVSDKWSIMVVMVLAHQPGRRARFSELKNGITGISQTMLTSTLRRLERDGIVVREVFPEIPPRVEYTLTKFGVGLIEPMNLLSTWVVKNWKVVKEARAAYDKQNPKKA